MQKLTNEMIKAGAIARAPIWQEDGKLLGYPQCCIDSFCNQNLQGIPKTTEQQIICDSKTFAGFIPCPEHAKQVFYKEIKIEDLITGRDKDIPAYPKG